MHYGNWAFSNNNKRTIEAIHDTKRLLGQRDGFSQTDVRQLNKVYKCSGYENVRVPPLKGDTDFAIRRNVYTGCSKTYKDLVDPSDKNIA